MVGLPICDNLFAHGHCDAVERGSHILRRKLSAMHVYAAGVAWAARPAIPCQKLQGTPCPHLQLLREEVRALVDLHQQLEVLLLRLEPRRLGAGGASMRSTAACTPAHRPLRKHFDLTDLFIELQC